MLWDDRDMEPTLAKLISTLCQVARALRQEDAASVQANMSIYLWICQVYSFDRHGASSENPLMHETYALLQSVAKACAALNQPERGFAALDEALRCQPGHKLFNVLAIDWDRGLNQRIYTSHPAAYPGCGAKPLRRDGVFFRQLVEAGESRICRTREECRTTFPDFELIEQLGCQSAINVPIRRQGVTLGSLNLLDESGWYTPQMVPGLHRFGVLAAPLLRSASQFRLHS